MVPNVMRYWKVKYKTPQGSIITASPILTYGADTPGAIEESVKKKYGQKCTLLSYDKIR